MEKLTWLQWLGSFFYSNLPVRVDVLGDGVPEKYIRFYGFRFGFFGIGIHFVTDKPSDTNS